MDVWRKSKNLKLQNHLENNTMDNLNKTLMRNYKII